MHADLETARTIALVTFRKDGTPVSTPVTPVVLDGKLCAITLVQSWKVKRIRRNPRVRVAPATLLGRVLGAHHEGAARIVDGPEILARVRAAQRQRFGWIAAVSTQLGRWLRDDATRTVIEVTL